VALHPVKFIIFPLLFTSIASMGFLKFKVENDLEYLFTPTTGQSVIEREHLFKYFPTNDSGQFTVSRKSTLGNLMRYVRLSA